MAEDGNGTLSEKLIAAKMRWAKEGRGLTGTAAASAPLKANRPRLPPGQHLVHKLPVLDLGVQPLVYTQDWSLTVAGAVDRPLKWSWNDFMDQPQTQQTCDIHCVTTWSIHDTRWAGVSARHLMERAQIRSSARFVVLRSYDGYATNLPLDQFAAEDVLIAHSYDGAPIPREHGGPVRVVVPQLYFWKSAKWLRAITFLEKDAPGYWEARGYHNNGDPWTEERYG